MKKFIFIFLAILVLLTGFCIYKLGTTEETVEGEKIQVVKFVRNIPIEKNKFYTITYEVDFSNNTVKKYDMSSSKEYQISDERLEWVKVAMAHCFENENLDIKELKESEKEYYSISVDDTVLLENRVNRMKQLTDALEEISDKKQK